LRSELTPTNQGVASSNLAGRQIYYLEPVYTRFIFAVGLSRGHRHHCNHR